jgi:hypothetical protein
MGKIFFIKHSAIGALFIGGSSCNKLADAAKTLWIVAESITARVWTLNTASVKAILPQVQVHCDTLPPNASVIIYCLDNLLLC